MNNKIAKSLVVAFILAIGIAEYTAEISYYIRGKEVSKKVYDYQQEINASIDLSGDDLNIWKKKEYNTIFIFLGFLGGAGLGYLLVGHYSDKKQAHL
jgi:hypothetical protein